MLMSLILLGDCSEERLDERKQMCFSLMDFDDVGEISIDELVSFSSQKVQSAQIFP